MHQEKMMGRAPGGLMLAVVIVLHLASVLLFIEAIGKAQAGLFILASVVAIIPFVMYGGFFIVNPNEAKVMLLFGNYKGTVKANGFGWTNPFMTKQRISLRARNLNGEKIKVNDLQGNPIEIAAVVVWRVENTAQASFDVDDYEEYVMTQSEAAVRHLASAYSYDGDDSELTLRGTTEEINERLEKELLERLSRAGVRVVEARLSHLAYAAEIAGAMLQRQQATAVVAARQKIVEGAVGMVEMALDELNKKQMVVLDEERKAAMVSNLLVVLCSEHAAQPVLNTGTLYQ